MYPTSCLYTSLQNISKKYKLISSLSAEVGPEGWTRSLCRGPPRRQSLQRTLCTGRNSARLPIFEGLLMILNLSLLVTKPYVDNCIFNACIYVNSWNDHDVRFSWVRSGFWLGFRLGNRPSWLFQELTENIRHFMKWLISQSECNIIRRYRYQPVGGLILFNNWYRNLNIHQDNGVCGVLRNKHLTALSSAWVLHRLILCK